jgi:hypothetical protein
MVGLHERHYGNKGRQRACEYFFERIVLPGMMSHKKF